jgi:hypothetical protein
MQVEHQWLFGRLRSGQASPGEQFSRPLFQNNQSKMYWRCGSSSREPALQAQSPEFELQSHQKKKEKIKKKKRKS